MARADRIKLLLLMGLFAAPVLAAWLAREHWRPAGLPVHGELLAPFAPGLDLPRGRWVLLTVAARDCDTACRHQLYLTRQVRLAQGRERGRVARALLQPPGGAAVEEPGLRRLLSPESGLEGLSADGSARTYVVDPLGRVMLRFPARPEGKGMIRDLGRLLKASGIG